MRRILIWLSVAVLVIGSGLAIARASDAGGWQGCFASHRGHFGPMSHIADKLNLNHAQEKQIQSMWRAEKPTVVGLVRQFSAESKEMDAATAQGNINERTVEEIASRQGTTIAKLLVEKEQFKARIYNTVLTPEQRAKADEMQTRWHERIDRWAGSSLNSPDAAHSRFR